MVQFSAHKSALSCSSVCARERRMMRKRARYAANRAAILARARKEYAANIDKYRERARKNKRMRWANNRAELCEKQRKYRADNPEKTREHNRKNNARKTDILRAIRELGLIQQGDLR